MTSPVRTAPGRLLLLAVLALLVAVMPTVPLREPEPAGAAGKPSQLRVMSAGDSVTQGALDRPSWRYGFQKRARLAGCAIDMVGPNSVLRDGASAQTIRPGMDHDHNAWGGRRSASIRVATARFVRIYRPEVLIVHAGVNDLTQGVPTTTTTANIEMMIVAARAANPNVAVLVTRPAAPAIRVRSETQDLGRRIQRLAARVDTQRSPVRVVDLASGWDLARMAMPGDFSHPNRTGEEFIAQRYAQAFLGLGLCGTELQGDHQAPSTPEWLRVTRTDSGDVAMSWGRATDNSGVVRYLIRRNGAGIGGTADNSYRVTGGSASAIYSVVPVDKFGNSGWGRGRRPS